MALGRAATTGCEPCVTSTALHSAFASDTASLPARQPPQYRNVNMSPAKHATYQRLLALKNCFWHAEAVLAELEGLQLGDVQVCGASGGWTVVPGKETVVLGQLEGCGWACAGTLGAWGCPSLHQACSSGQSVDA